MATSKPNTLAKLIPGKLIDTVRNFCATMNWVISCWDNFSVGDGLKFQAKSLEGGKPKLELNLEAGDNVEITDNKGKKKIAVKNVGGNYIKGDDTNIVFTPVTSGADAGKVKVDVYYL